MSRFADQLPIVTEPTADNFLLGTDENDPKALVRIPFAFIHGFLIAPITASYAAVPYEKIPLDSTAGGFTVTLPESNGIIWLFDEANFLATNPVTLAAPVGFTVHGGATYSLATNKGAWQFELMGTNWIKFYG